MAYDEYDYRPPLLSDQASKNTKRFPVQSLYLEPLQCKQPPVESDRGQFSYKVESIFYF